MHRFSILLVSTLMSCGQFSARSDLRAVDTVTYPKAANCGLQSLSVVSGQPFTMLADEALPGHLRVIWPGQHISTEFIPSRLNATVTTDGSIIRLFCG